MRSKFISTLICISIFACCESPTPITCDSSLLIGFDNGELTTNFNETEKSFSSYFEYLGESNQLFGLSFNSPHSSNCYYIDNVILKDSVSNLSTNGDTIFLYLNRALYFMNSQSDVTSAIYEADPTYNTENWLLINSINEDTTEIIGKFNLNLLRVFPDTTFKDQNLEEFITIKNAMFTSELR